MAPSDFKRDRGIFQTLCELGVADPSTREVYAHSTRDMEGLTVFRDTRSGVVYIDGFYTGDKTYESGAYRQDADDRLGPASYEEQADAARRTAAFRELYVGREIADFGCGKGEFLRAVAGDVASCVGIELQQDAIAALNRDGIACTTSIGDLAEGSIDTVFSFHVLEHLPNPVEILERLRTRLKEDGTLVIEVPHAGDFLLTQVDNAAFRKFTLWSQHLVLHTRESLRRLLARAGYRDIVIEGVQRYPLSNHVRWMAEQRPGGHKSKFARLDTPELTAAYEASLRNIDATDTLIATARK